MNLTEFTEVIKEGVVCVDFYASWCGPCVAFAPKFEEAAKLMPEGKFIKIDVDASGDVAQKHNIRSIPTIILFKDGVKIGDRVGAFASAVSLIDWINDLLVI